MITEQYRFRYSDLSDLAIGRDDQGQLWFQVWAPHPGQKTRATHPLGWSAYQSHSGLEEAQELLRLKAELDRLKAAPPPAPVDREALAEAPAGMLDALAEELYVAYRGNDGRGAREYFRRGTAVNRSVWSRLAEAALRFIGPERPQDPACALALCGLVEAVESIPLEPATSDSVGKAILDAALVAAHSALRPIGQAGTPTPVDREALGREVRLEWIRWAREQPNPKPSWLLSWEEMTEPEREVDRRIGERIARLAGQASAAARQGYCRKCGAFAGTIRDAEGPLCAQCVALRAEILPPAVQPPAEGPCARELREMENLCSVWLAGPRWSEAQEKELRRQLVARLNAARSALAEQPEPQATAVDVAAVREVARLLVEGLPNGDCLSLTEMSNRLLAALGGAGEGAPRKVKPDPPPRIDEVYARGQQWLDSGKSERETEDVKPDRPCESCGAESDGLTLDDVPLCDRCAKELEAEEQKPSFWDDPDLDGTDGAHPAWWRGDDHGYQKGLARGRADQRHRDLVELAAAFGGGMCANPNWPNETAIVPLCAAMAGEVLAAIEAAEKEGR